MEFTVLHVQMFPLLRVNLLGGEVLNAESSTFVSMSSGIQIKTHPMGGQIRSYSSGQNADTFYLNTFRTSEQDGEVHLAPRTMGEIRIISLNELPVLIQPSVFLAAEDGVKLQLIRRGTNISRAGVQLFRCTGKGKLVLASCGAIQDLELKEDENLLVKAGHLFLVEDGMPVRLRQFGGFQSPSVGDSFILDVSGAGKLSLQSRIFEYSR